jgi:hypothetical protein
MICPVCVANAAMTIAGVTTSGGLAGILATRFRSSRLRALKMTWRQIRLMVAMF